MVTICTIISNTRILHFTPKAYLCVLQDSQNKQLPFPYTTLVKWYLQWSQSLSSERYELNFYIYNFCTLLGLSSCSDSKLQSVKHIYIISQTLPLHGCKRSNKGNTKWRENREQKCIIWKSSYEREWLIINVMTILKKNWQLQGSKNKTSVKPFVNIYWKQSQSRSINVNRKCKRTQANCHKHLKSTVLMAVTGTGKK